MGVFSLTFVLLASLVSTVVAQMPFHHSKQPVISVDLLPPLPTSAVPEPTTVLTVDCLFCSATDDKDVTTLTETGPRHITVGGHRFSIITDEFSRESSTTYGAASQTIICAPPCQTLVTVPWRSGESKAAPVTPSPIMTSCITIYNTPSPSVETLTLSELSSSTSCTSTSTHMSPWTWERPEIPSTEVASSELGLPPWSSAATEAATSIFVSEVTDTVVYPSKTKLTFSWSFISIETSSTTETSTETMTEVVPASEPCTTDITVTMTKTVVETWQSKTPQTVTLSSTISTTIETVIVEAYSTSTGEVVVGGTRTELTTIEAVSSGADCTEVAGKCCGGCSPTAEYESATVETISSTFVSTLTTVEEYVSSAGGSVVPAASVTGESGNGESSPTTSLALVETTTLSGSETETETETDAATSVQTAGAAHVTAAMGIGAILGLMGLLA